MLYILVNTHSAENSCALKVYLVLKIIMSFEYKLVHYYLPINGDHFIHWSTLQLWRKIVETMYGYEIFLIKQSKLEKLFISILLFMLKNTRKVHLYLYLLKYV